MNGLYAIIEEMNRFENIRKPYTCIKINLDWFNSHYNGEWKQRWGFQGDSVQKEELETMHLLGLPFKVDNSIKTYELGI